MFPTDFLQRLWTWWTRRSQKDIQLECLNAARYYEEWEAAAFALDELYGNDLWLVLPHVVVGNDGLRLFLHLGDRILLPNIMIIDSFIQDCNTSLKLEKMKTFLAW